MLFMCIWFNAETWPGDLLLYMCSCFVAAVEFERDSYVVNENDGTVEVCLVIVGENIQNISASISISNSTGTISIYAKHVILMRAILSHSQVMNKRGCV